MKGVTLCLVTRGDVPLDKVLAPAREVFDDIVIWNNSKERDMKVFGRFCAVPLAKTDTVAFCDDDVIVPTETWETLYQQWQMLDGNYMVVNDAHGDNPGGYEDVALTATGAIVTKKLIDEAMDKWDKSYTSSGASELAPDGFEGILYECDFVLGILIPHVTLKLPYTNLYPNHGNRLCDQPWQEDLKQAYTNMAREIRDK